MQQDVRDALDRVAHAIFVLEPDADGVPRYRHMNTFARTLAGKTEAEINGRTAQEVFGGRLGRIALDHHLAVMRTGQRREYDGHLPLTTGRRTINTVLTPEIDARGRVVQIFGATNDTTAQRILARLGAEMRTMQSEAREFVALAAHDERAPVRQVRMIAELIRDGIAESDDGKLDLIAMLENLSIRTVTMVTEVLSLAEPVTAALEQRCFQFGDVARNVLVVLDPDQTCDCTLAEAELETDWADVQIGLRTLVENALRHGGSNRGRGDRLGLALAVRAVADDLIEIRVSDTGRGFSDPQKALPAQDGPGARGSYGLIALRRLLHARCGTISVANRVDGPGAEAVFTLPGRVVGAAAEPSACAG
jgi:signal transduction histidine kinase